MSQIETLMLLGLGFAVAALISLFVARGLWHYALRLGGLRTQRAAPSAMAELQSDRDRLRAEYAMLSRKLELRLMDLKTRLAEQMAEVARSRNRIDTLITEVEKRDGLLAARDEEIATLKLQLSPFESELASRTQSIQQLKEQIRDRDEDIDAMRQTIENLTREIAERDLHIATMTVEGATAGGPASSIPPDAYTAHERLRQRIEELSELSMQIESQRAQLDEQQRELVALKKTIDIAKSDVVEHPPERAQPAVSLPAPERPSETRFKMLDAGSRTLEQQIQVAEKETEALEEELRQLDENWSTRLAALGLSNANGTEVPAREAGSVNTPQEARSAGRGDASQPQKLAVPPAEMKRSSRGFANVISLAARIRALQKDIGK
jgi:peptidoglycan hydrolase CwlO-like protein